MHASPYDVQSKSREIPQMQVNAMPKINQECERESKGGHLRKSSGMKIRKSDYECADFLGKYLHEISEEPPRDYASG